MANFNVSEEDKYKYTIHDHVDFTIEESQNFFTAFRKASWGNSSPHYEIRRWKNMPDGSEQANKGVTFLTEEGPTELVNTLVGIGFGDTKIILDSLKEREDFRRCLNTVLGKDDPNYDQQAGTVEDQFFDPKELLQQP